MCFVSAMLNRPCSSLADVLKVPSFVSFVLSSLCVAPNFVDVRICQQISPNKAIWNNGMIWGKTAVTSFVLLILRRKTFNKSPSWKVARKQNLIWSNIIVKRNTSMMNKSQIVHLRSLAQTCDTINDSVIKICRRYCKRESGGMGQAG